MAEWKANKASKEPRGSQKWKPKDSDAAAPEVESKGSEEPVSSGPRYEKALMLQVFGAIQSSGALTSEAPEKTTTDAKEEEEPNEEVAFKVEERPTADGEEGGRTPGFRRSLREQKKAKKAAAAAEAGEELPFQATTSEMSHQPSQRQNLDLGAVTPGATPNAAGFGMPPMYPPVYPGMYPPYAAPSPPAAPPPAAGASTASPLQAALNKKATAKSMVLLRHVPADLSREALVELLNKDYKGTFDFVYLPGSTKKDGGNRGYAFINFRRKVEKFTEACHGIAPSVALGTPAQEGEKCLEIEKARLPTLDKTLTEMARKPRPEAAPWQPLLFDETGQAKPFPLTPPPPPEGAVPASMPQMPPFGSPYPPYPGMYNHAYASAMAAQVADVHRRAAVAAWAAVGELTDKSVAPLDDEKKSKLKEQIEFYFSNDNLCKDLYLRSHMNAEGWTPLELIAAFPKVKSFNVSDQQILEVLRESTVLEVDPLTLYIRLKDEKNRSKWTKVTAEYRSQLMSAAMMQSYQNSVAFQASAAAGKGGGRRRKSDEKVKGGGKGGKRGGKGASSPAENGGAAEGEKPKAAESAAPAATAAAEPAATVTAGGDS